MIEEGNIEELSLDLPDATGEDTWSAEKEMRFEQFLYITAQAEEKLADLTSKLGADWFTLAMTAAQFGEKGREVFHRLSKLSGIYDEADTNKKFDLGLKKSKYKTLFQLIKICKEHSLEYKLPQESYNDKFEYQFLPEDAYVEGYDPSEDMREYGFFQYKKAYYTLERGGTGFIPTPFTNFIMEVKYHIADKKAPRRIVRFTNNRGQSKTVDMPTQALSSLNAFIQFIEGLGNFLFEGGIGHLRKLKRKLYESELSCKQVETLGHHEDGLYIFSNGAFNYDEVKFLDIDEDGVLKLGGESYYVPSGNKAYANDRFLYANEKRFKHLPTDITFVKWAKDYYTVFGKQSAIELTFAVACLFSDVVFNALEGFPILFLYGEGSSGKGTRAKNLQRLTGIPQDGLKISEKANTDKAKIREMAQFINGIILLEEYTNDIDAKATNTLKGIWDRYGYKRAVMDSKFGTESVPINSGTIMTGNEYPIDDPFIQRFIALEINSNEFSEEQKRVYNEFKDLAALGITNVTLELLKHRRHVEENYKGLFRDCYKDVNTQLFGMEVTDRMINNNAALAGIYKTLADVVVWPFTYDALLAEIKTNTDIQSRKRVSGAVVQQFWDTFCFLVNSLTIHHTNEFQVSGDELRLKLAYVYPHYARAMRDQGVSPMPKSTLQDKLKNADSFIEVSTSVRIGGGNSSGIIFSISKLLNSNINIIEVVDNADKRRKRPTDANNGIEPTPEAMPSKDKKLKF